MLEDPLPVACPGISLTTKVYWRATLRPSPDIWHANVLKLFQLTSCLWYFVMLILHLFTCQYSDRSFMIFMFVCRNLSSSSSCGLSAVRGRNRTRHPSSWSLRSWVSASEMGDKCYKNNHVIGCYWHNWGNLHKFTGLLNHQKPGQLTVKNQLESTLESKTHINQSLVKRRI